MVGRLGEHVGIKLPVVSAPRNGRTNGKVESYVKMVRPYGGKEFVLDIMSRKRARDEKNIQTTLEMGFVCLLGSPSVLFVGRVVEAPNINEVKLVEKEVKFGETLSMVGGWRRTSPVKRWVGDQVEVPSQHMNRSGTEIRRETEEKSRTMSGSSRGINRKNLQMLTFMEESDEQDTSMRIVATVRYGKSAM